MIELKDFTIGFGKRKLLENITETFPASSLISLIGRNGTGKSTLLRAMCGLNDKYSGEIFINGLDVRKCSRLQLAHKIAFVNTKRPRIANLRCEDVVALGRSPFTDWIGRISKADKEMVRDALKSVKMEEFASRSLDSLSDGEAQRIMIARAIAQDTDIIILDEPTSFLDLPTRFEIVELLKELSHSEGKTIIFSTHELDIAVEMCDQISLIDNSHLHLLPVDRMISAGHLQRLFPLPSNYLDRLLNK